MAPYWNVEYYEQLSRVICVTELERNTVEVFTVVFN